MKTIYQKYLNGLDKLRDIPLLFLRLMMAYGFYQPAMNKMKDLDAVSQWFDSMNYPVPVLSAYLAGVTEFLGVFLLLLGLGTRFITLPLMFVMIIAITTVHGGSGFAASGGGFEIPFYYLLMLFVIHILGPGRLSLDHLIGKKLKK